MFRIATKDDIESIAAIYEHIHDAEEAGNAVVGWVRNVYPTYNTAAVGVADGDMFVEEDGNTIVAAGRINHLHIDEYNNCRWSFKAPDEQVMILHTLVVEPSCKGYGYGSAFVKFYEEYALSHGCHFLRIDTQEKNKNAREFYKNHGFCETGVVLCNFCGIPDVRLVCLEKMM